MPVSSLAALSLQPQRGMDDAQSLAAHPESEDHGWKLPREFLNQDFSKWEPFKPEGAKLCWGRQDREPEKWLRIRALCFDTDHSRDPGCLSGALRAQLRLHSQRDWERSVGEEPYPALTDEKTGFGEGP